MVKTESAITIIEKEKRISWQHVNDRDKTVLPEFTFGEEFLVGNKSKDPKASLLKFSQDWINNPNKYLDLENFKYTKTREVAGLITRFKIAV